MEQLAIINNRETFEHTCGNHYGQQYRVVSKVDGVPTELQDGLWIEICQTTLGFSVGVILDPKICIFDDTAWFVDKHGWAWTPWGRKDLACRFLIVRKESIYDSLIETTEYLSSIDLTNQQTHSLIPLDGVIINQLGKWKPPDCCTIDVRVHPGPIHCTDGGLKRQLRCDLDGPRPCSTCGLFLPGHGYHEKICVCEFFKPEELPLQILGLQETTVYAPLSETVAEITECRVVDNRMEFVRFRPDKDRGDSIKRMQQTLEMKEFDISSVPFRHLRDRLPLKVDNRITLSGIDFKEARTVIKKILYRQHRAGYDYECELGGYGTNVAKIRPPGHDVNVLVCIDKGIKRDRVYRENGFVCHEIPLDLSDISCPTPSVKLLYRGAGHCHFALGQIIANPGGLAAFKHHLTHLSLSTLVVSYMDCINHLSENTRYEFDQWANRSLQYEKTEGNDTSYTVKYTGAGLDSIPGKKEFIEVAPTRGLLQEIGNVVEHVCFFDLIRALGEEPTCEGTKLLLRSSYYAVIELETEDRSRDTCPTGGISCVPQHSINGKLNDIDVDLLGCVFAHTIRRSRPRRSIHRSYRDYCRACKSQGMLKNLRLTSKRFLHATNNMPRLPIIVLEDSDSDSDDWTTYDRLDCYDVPDRFIRYGDGQNDYYRLSGYES